MYFYIRIERLTKSRFIDGCIFDEEKLTQFKAFPRKESEKTELAVEIWALLWTLRLQIKSNSIGFFLPKIFRDITEKRVFFAKKFIFYRSVDSENNHSYSIIIWNIEDLASEKSKFSLSKWSVHWSQIMKCWCGWICVPLTITTQNGNGSRALCSHSPWPHLYCSFHRAWFSFGTIYQLIWTSLHSLFIKFRQHWVFFIPA